MCIFLLVIEIIDYLIVYILTLPPGAWIVRPELTFLCTRVLCNSAEQAPARRAQSVPHWAAQCSYRHTLYWSYVTVSARQGPPWSQIFTSSHVPATTWSPANFNMHHQNLSFASRISSHTFLAAEDAAQHKLTNMFPDYLAHPAL